MRAPGPDRRSSDAGSRAVMTLATALSVPGAMNGSPGFSVRDLGIDACGKDRSVDLPRIARELNSTRRQNLSNLVEGLGRGSICAMTAWFFGSG